MNLFFSQLINVNTKTLPQNDASLKHQCLLLMDEFTSDGRVDIISKAVAYMAGYNLRLLPIIQSMAQLDAVYGKELRAPSSPTTRCRSSMRPASSRTPTTIRKCWAIRRSVVAHGPARMDRVAMSRITRCWRSAP